MSHLVAFSARDPASNQLLDWSKKHEDENRSMTTDAGNPIAMKTASETVGFHGPTLLQDWVLVNELSHFSRERIPERVVHAKGAAAFGYFEVTHDITQYTAAKVFSEIGKRTPIAVRYSQVAGEKGYADTYRDLRGFAIKFYTEDGIWDLVGNNSPIFFVNDAANFPSFIHALKRNPVTNIRPDYDAFFDFVSLRTESAHQTIQLFTDRGIPASYRRMHGYGANTFSFINSDGKFFYCKFHYLTNQGIANLTQSVADKLAGEQPDFLVRDLYNAIAGGDYPSWSFYVQIMTPEQAAKNPYDPFDNSKVWLHGDYPLIPVGRFVLNKNPSNYFAEVEQLAFDVSHLIPGIDISPDRMLQGRVYNYGDTQRYRLGINGNQLPVNSPFRMANYERDGKTTLNSQGGAPNYFPNSFRGPENDKRAQALYPTIPLVGSTQRTDNGLTDNYTQGRLLWQKVLKDDERERTIQNALAWLRQTNSVIAERTITNIFEKTDQELGRRLREGLKTPQILDTHVAL
ncbi:catalase-like [Cylas formicarius]|uniref:catalase-like n=1 Tax=Cylas formicarius TaxID=197179 RepID=UPI00295842E9|nr:catalase-like [Cylas formicarius]XP_060523641.1 catalase-like [Cylas formicarius]